MEQRRMENQGSSETDGAQGSKTLIVENWGLLDYSQSLALQHERLEKLREYRTLSSTQNSPLGYLLFCSHPPVVTRGRATQPNDLQGWKGLCVDISRGGRLTYHGPHQIIMYAICDLNRVSRPRDIRWFLNTLETPFIHILQEKYGLSAQSYPGPSLDSKSSPLPQEQNPSKENHPHPNLRGIWIGNRKIASLGIGVRNWISYHGIAFNLYHDPKAFQGIRPCGFSPETMVSLEELLNQPLPHEERKFWENEIQKKIQL